MARLIRSTVVPIIAASQIKSMRSKDREHDGGSTDEQIKLSKTFITALNSE